jgi:hypothetical protein
MAPRPTRRPANRFRIKARLRNPPNRKVLRHRRPFWKVNRDITNRFARSTPVQPVADVYSPTARFDPAGERPPNTDPRANLDDPALRAAQLRGAIDSGHMGDKVNVSDPAAAPLGTDAESGGHQPTREEVAIAADRELAGPEDQGIARRPIAPRTGLFERPLPAGFAVGAIVAAAGLLVLIALGLVG